MTSPIAEQLTERFFRYLAVTSQSDAAATTLPSTPGQHEMRSCWRKSCAGSAWPTCR